MEERENDRRQRAAKEERNRLAFHLKAGKKRRLNCSLYTRAPIAFCLPLPGKLHLNSFVGTHSSGSLLISVLIPQKVKMELDRALS